MEWVCAVVRCLMILLEPVFTRKVGHNRAFKAYMRTGTRACVFFSVGRVCSDPLLLGPEANWVGWLGLAGDGRAGWLVRLVRLCWLGPSPVFLPLCGECWERGEKRLGRGWDCAIHVYYVCVLGDIYFSIVFNFEKEAG